VERTLKAKSGRLSSIVRTEVGKKKMTVIDGKTLMKKLPVEVDREHPRD